MKARKLESKKSKKRRKRIEKVGKKKKKKDGRKAEREIGKVAVVTISVNNRRVSGEVWPTGTCHRRRLEDIQGRHHCAPGPPVSDT